MSKGGLEEKAKTIRNYEPPRGSTPAAFVAEFGPVVRASKMRHEKGQAKWPVTLETQTGYKLEISRVERHLDYLVGVISLSARTSSDTATRQLLLERQRTYEAARRYA